MTIQQFGLTAEQILKRRDGIGGSDANVIMSGDPARVHGLWEEKTGQAEPEDLSRVLAVQMGTFTEPFNAHWYTLTTGNEITNRGELLQHPSHTFMRCNLDGKVPTRKAIWEGKHVNAYSKIDAVIQKYMPQLHHNAGCAGLDRAVLSVFVGTMVYEVAEVEIDPFYLATLIDAEAYFWNCVQTMTPPGEIKVEAAPIPPALLRTVDMTGRNEWASEANSWIATKAIAKTFTDAEKSLKSMVEFDVGEAFGHGVKISRAKNGALTIRRHEDA